MATVIGLLALLVSGYTAYVQRQQLRAQVWPNLTISTTNVPPEIGIHIVNPGTGPARRRRDPRDRRRSSGRDVVGRAEGRADEGRRSDPILVRQDAFYQLPFGPTMKRGMMTRQEFAERYLTRSGRQVPARPRTSCSTTPSA